MPPRQRPMSHGDEVVGEETCAQKIALGHQFVGLPQQSDRQLSVSSQQFMEPHVDHGDFCQEVLCHAVRHTGRDKQPPVFFGNEGGEQKRPASVQQSGYSRHNVLPRVLVECRRIHVMNDRRLAIHGLTFQALHSGVAAAGVPGLPVRRSATAPRKMRRRRSSRHRVVPFLKNTGSRHAHRRRQAEALAL